MFYDNGLKVASADLPVFIERAAAGKKPFCLARSHENAHIEDFGP
jgi:hypothetical protein